MCVKIRGMSGGVALLFWHGCGELGLSLPHAVRCLVSVVALSLSAERRSGGLSHPSGGTCSSTPLGGAKGQRKKK